MKTDVKKLVQHGMVDRGISLHELADLMGTSAQNISNKLQRNDMKISDLEKIFEAMGYELTIDYSIDS